jgi:hypothetical protein
MDFQIDIYQCEDGHVHIVLRGFSEGTALFSNFEAFSKFVDACEEFLETRTPIPQAFLDAFD